MKEKVTSTEKGLATDKKYINPFPGLRPFNIEDSHLFFGREGQSDELLKKLAENRFVGVIGASGSGKSSLMFCGLVPTLQGGFITEAGSNWKIVTTRPGGGPIENLANALLKNEFTGILNEEEPIIKKALTQAVLRNSSRGLVEAVKQLDRAPDENILLLVDQFEELFRFKKSRKDSSSANESAAFVKLLLEAVKQKEVPIYVVMTMRSDFIGDCSQFPELTQKINDSHYLIPQMTRANLQEAITGPVAVAGGKIAPRLVQQLLNDVGDNPDQLPILQHALMRTWDYWENNHEAGEPMDTDHYEAIGKMAKALSEHANEAFDELSDSGKKICEALFKAITEKGSDSRGIRHPEKVAAISAICQVADDQVIKVVEAFRKPGRSFLTPSVEVAPTITTDAIIDISHESLMRIWDRLKTWVEEEAGSVQMYQRLSEAAAMYQLGKTSLWRPPDLLIAQNWKEKQQPTLSWARRYNPAYERTMVFLDTSIREYDTEEQNKVRLQKRTLKRARIVTIIVSAAAVISLGLMVYSFNLQVEANRQKQTAVEKAEEARKEKEKAEEQKKIALLKEEEARKEKEKAEEQRKIALLKEEEARKEKEKADEQRKIAEQQTELAKRQTKKAEEAKAQAERSADIAKKQTKKAEEANALALNRQMQSTAKTMALKSVQVNKDPDQKGLMAYQAYLFNERYQGNAHSPEVYEGLYSALKLTNPDGYNALKAHKDAVRSLAFSYDGRSLYSAGSDGKILSWNPKNPSDAPKVIIKNDFINRAIAVSQNGLYLACGSEKNYIQLFDLTGDVKAGSKKLTGHKGEVLALSFTPDSKSLVSAGGDTTILFWDIASGQSTLIAKTQSKVLGMAIDQKGKMIAGATEGGQLIIWTTNADKGYMATELWKQDKNPLYSVAFSNDGNYVVASDQSGQVRIWNVNTKELVTTLVGYNARVIDIKYSPDGKMLAGACFDGNIQLWTTDNLNDPPVVLKDNGAWVMSMDFSPDGKQIVAGCSSGLIRIYSTDTKSMAEQMCSKLKRNMSKKEWTNNVSKEVPYEKTCPSLPAGEGVDK